MVKQIDQHKVIFMLEASMHKVKLISCSEMKGMKRNEAIVRSSRLWLEASTGDNKSIGVYNFCLKIVTNILAERMKMIKRKIGEKEREI